MLVLCVAPVLFDPFALVISPYLPFSLSMPVARWSIQLERAVGLIPPPMQVRSPKATPAARADKRP